MNLRARFTLAALLIASTVLSSAFASLYVFERRQLLEKAYERAEESTRKLAQVCEEALATQSDLVALNYIRVWREGPGAREVVLVRSDGTVYLHSSLLDGDSSLVSKPARNPFAARSLSAPHTLRETLVSGGFKVLQFGAPVTRYGQRFGSVVAVYDLSRIESGIAEDLEAAAQRMTLASAGALAVALLLSVGFAIGLSQPILALTEGARRVGSGDFSFRIDSRRSDELGLLAREFDEMAKKLGELDQLKDRFVHSVSHEMRAPLSVAASAVYHARRVLEGAAPDGVLQDLGQIERSLERLGGFVNNILELARLQAGRTAFRFQTADPARLLEEAREEHGRRAEQYRIRLEVRAAPPLPPVRADPSRIQQVLSNLVLNAFKFTPDGGTVRLSVRREDGAVVFSVSDTGPGIPERAIGGLFSRFGVSDPAPNPRKLPSSGLGLSICREIVEAHKGRIWVRTSEGSGTTFLFSVPVEDRVAA